ncbi:MAG TPA: hypothetical protein ENI94_12795 [Gammaproteobacteria bacterium]|nr:hypothetical protein [Gammaproteobacteria bacterium]
MSEIRRTLTPDSGIINIAGPSGGGGIVLQKAAVPQECPPCEGGSCVPDSFVSQWVGDAGSGMAYLGTSIDNGATDDVYPPVFGVVADTSTPVENATELCCNDVTWDIVITGEGLYYDIVNGMVSIRESSYGGQITATPTVCGVTLDSLVYNLGGI